MSHNRNISGVAQPSPLTTTVNSGLKMFNDNPYFGVPSLKTIICDSFDVETDIDFKLDPVETLYTFDWEFVESTDFRHDEYSLDWFLHLKSKRAVGEFRGNDFKLCRSVIGCSRAWLIVLHKIRFDHDLDVTDFPYYTPDLGFMKLLLSGDVETNPGPVQSRLVAHNDKIVKFQQMMARHEQARKKQAIKAKQMRRELRKNKREVFDRATLENHGPVENFLRNTTGLEKDKVRDTLESVCKVAGSVDSVIEQLKENIPTLASKHSVLTDHATRACDMISQFMSKLNNMSDKIENYFNIIKTKIGNLTYLQIVASILTVIAVCTLPKKYKIFPMVLAVLYLMGWSSSVIEKIKSIFTRQQNHSFESYIPLIGQCIFTMLAFLGVNAIPSDRYYTELLRRLDLIPKACSGVSKIWEQAGNIFNAVSTEFQVYVLNKERPDLSIMEQRAIAVNELVSEVEKWNEIENRKLLANDSDAVHAVIKLQEQLNHWMHSTTKWQSFSPEEKRVLLSLRPVVLDLFKLASKSSIFEGGFRNIPLAILLTGGTGLGKSRLLDPLSFALLNHRGIPAKDIKDNVYVRASETEFWDGYHGQKLVQVDEFGQIKDTVGKPNVDMMEAMRMINNAPYPLHMAELTDKGQHFVSEVVIFASNISHSMISKINSLVFPKAAIRRLNVHAYRLTLKNAFTTRTIEKRVPLSEAHLYPCGDGWTGRIVEVDGEHFQILTKQERDHKYCTLVGGEWLVDPEKVGYNPINPEKGCEECKRLYESEPIYQEIGSIEFCKHHYNFERYNVFNDEVIEQNISFDALLKQLTEKDTKIQASQTNLLKTYDAFQRNPQLLFNHSGDEEFFDADDSIRPEEWIARYTPQMTAQVGAVDLANCFDYANFMFYEAYRNVMQQMHGQSYTLDIENQFLANSPILLNMYDRINFCGFVNRNQNEYKTEVWEVVSHSMYFDSLFKSFLRKDETCFERLKYTVKKNLRETAKRINDWWKNNSLFDFIPLATTILSLVSIGALIYSFSGSTTKVCYSCESEIDECTCKEELREFQDYMHIRRVYNIDNDTFWNLIGQASESSGEIKMQKQVQQKVESSGEIKAQRKVQQKVESSGEIKAQRSVPQKVESSGEIRAQRRVTQVAESYLTASESMDVQENEGVTDMNAHNIVNKLLRQSIYLLHTNDTVIGNVMFVTGRVLLMPYHYVSRMITFLDNGVELHLSNISGRNLVTFPASVVKNHVRLCKNGEAQDAILVTLSNIEHKVSHHVNIVNMFMPSTNVSALSANATYTAHVPVIVDFLEESKPLKERTKQLGYSLLPATHLKSYFDKNASFDINQSDGTILTYREYYAYNINSVPGNCGAPLVLYNQNVTHKLLGIHVTGSAQGWGTSQIITQEMLREGLKSVPRDAQCSIQVDDVTPIDLDTIRVDNVPCDGLIVHGKLPHKISFGNSTKIIPSPLNNKIAQAKTKPTFSEDVNSKDAMYKGLIKYTANPPRITPSLIKTAAEDVNNLMHINWMDKNPEDYMRVLTYEEAVLGNDDLYIAPLNRNTSCGYPWTVKYPNLIGKRQAFGHDEWTMNSPLALEIKQAVENLEEDCLQGIQRNVLWTDTLKDERRPIEKVDMGKIRVFCGGPVHFTILFRMYFLGFAAWTMHSRNVNGVSTGTNVFSEDWDVIAKKLLSKSKKIVAGDFSNFDGTLNQQILWALFNLIDAFYAEYETEEQFQRNHKIRYTLWMHIAQATHVCGSVVYNVTHCQPSGCPLTAILNSWYFLLLCRIVFLLCAMMYESQKMLRRGTLANMDIYNKCVAEVSYGDDNVVAVHDSIAEWFNQQTMTDAFLVCGHVYTDEAKSGVQYVTRDLEEIAYLKRKFIFDDTSYRYIAPLDLDVILEIPQWTKRGSLEESILYGNIDIALRELSLHGEEIFNKYKRIIQKECLSVGINYPFRTFAEYKSDVLNIDNWQLNESGNDWIMHCVSADFALRKGFAATLLKQRPEARKFVEKMRQRPHRVGYVAIDNAARVIHLVTKVKATDKPNSNFGLVRCLRTLSTYNFPSSVNCPMIGCGLDGRVNGMCEWTKAQLQDFINMYCPNLDIKVQGPDVIFQNEENSESLIDLNCYQDNEMSFLALPPKMSRGSPTLSRVPRCEINV